MLDERHFGAPPRDELARTKLGQLRAEMKALGLEAAILNRSDNLRLVTGILPTDSLLYYNRQATLVLADRDTPVLFSASGFSEELRARVRGRFWIEDIRLLPRVQDVWGDIFIKALQDYGVSKGRVGIDPHMSYRTGKILESRFKGYELVDLADVLNRLRALKTRDEIRAIEESCALAELGLAAGWRALHEGMTETELCATVSASLLAAGAEALYARRGTLVVSGERMSYQQESPSLTRIRNGDFVMIDVGPALRGYYCDYCRTALVGRPSPWQRELYAAAYGALQAALARVRAGVSGAELHGAAGAVMEKAGFRHATPLIGHGVGVSPQEPPYCVAGELAVVAERGGEKVALEAGMVVAFSSAAYLPGRGACRFEEVVEVMEGGYRLLSRAPYPGLESFLG